MGQKWMKWAFLEALMRTSSATLQKVLGIVSTAIGQLFFVMTIIGLIQVMVGFFSVRIRGGKILAPARHIVGSLGFGLIAAVASVVGFSAYFYGGEMGTIVFIVSLSIIPGALIDTIFFQHRPDMKECAGILVGILAAYYMLNRPSFEQIIHLPVWAWLAFLGMWLVAINQGITQWIKDIDPMVKNFWGGLVGILTTISGMAYLGHLNLFTDFSPQMQKIYIVAAGIGLIVILMWTFNVWGYKDGASIAVKKLVVGGSNLILSTVMGFLLFEEAITLSKVAGILLFFVAFALVDRGTWMFIMRSSKPN